MSYTSLKKFLSVLMVALVTLGGLVVAAPAADAALASVVVTSRGDLRITGTSVGEIIGISESDVSGRYLVTVSGPNGASEGFYNGVTRDITINSRGGGDAVRIFGDTTVPRHLSINFGNGIGKFESGTGTAGGNIRIVGGNHVMSVDLLFSEVEGTVQVRNGRGTLSSSIDGTHFYRSANLSTNGKMLLSIADSTFEQGLTLTGTNDDDELRLVRSQISGRTAINLKGGNDYIDVNDGMELRGLFSLRLGSGRDRAVLENARFGGSVNVAGQAENDEIFVATSVFSHRSVVFSGGAGNDQISGEFNVFNTAPRIISFETS